MREMMRKKRTKVTVVAKAKLGPKCSWNKCPYPPNAGGVSREQS
jgi:hypothetical protein